MELGREILRQKLNLELENSVMLSSANMIAGAESGRRKRRNGRSGSKTAFSCGSKEVL